MERRITTSVRTIRLVLGMAIVFVGLVWIGQGLGLIGGGFMSGDQRWAGIGVLLAVLGGYLAATAVRRRT
jgi:hypothetical protein